MQPLPVAGALAPYDRGQHPLGQHRARCGVAERDAHAPWPRTRRAGDRHDAAHALGNLVDARSIGIGAVLAEARQARVDQPGIAGSQHLGADAQPVFHRRAHVLDEDVGGIGEAEERRKSVGVLQVDRDGTLVAVQVVAVAPCEVAASWHRDLDDLRAEVGELTHAGRAAAGRGEIDDPEV
ncbi:unannotated protein [freshwater metagenome]|uniref:Unannotated protein n=1 Tax=freshwater metagenome TaxID=449393 RepID=A0A6J7NGR5_9ZZZZ